MPKEVGDPIEVRQAFAEELRVIAARKNWTNGEVATKVGVDQTFISRLSNGKLHWVPGREVLIDWCKRLDLTWDEQFPLFGRLKSFQIYLKLLVRMKLFCSAEH